MEEMQYCSRCGSMRSHSDFMDGSITRKCCARCRKASAEARKRVRQTVSEEIQGFNQENAISFDNISNTVYDEILGLEGLDDDLEGSVTFHLEFCVLWSSVMENIGAQECSDYSLAAAKLIASEVGNGDGYSYVHQKTHCHENTNTTAYTYWCNCRDDLAKKPKKINDISKQRGTESHLVRYPCHGQLSIKICQEIELVFVKIQHEQLHSRPEKVSVSTEVRNYIAAHTTKSVPDIYQAIKDNQLDGCEYITVKQVYYWWALAARCEYQRSDDELLSAKVYLAEHQQELLFSNEHGFAFATKFLQMLPDSVLFELMVDATYNTNKQKYELYGAMAIVDGTGFPLSYLFLATGKNRPVCRTITEWFAALKERRLTVIETFYTDKDFAQISAAKATWPEVNVQLCLWHVKRAIEQKLSSRAGQQSRYNPQDAHQLCSFIDKTWQPIVFQSVNDGSNNKRKSSSQLCDKQTRTEIKSMVEQHFNKHCLIPHGNGLFFESQQIWNACVTEMYNYCRQQNLVSAWAYLWNEWYTPTHWALWARSSYNKISILRTTMVIESHWRMIKRDHLYKFNRPRLDLLCFVIVQKVLSRQIDCFSLLCKQRQLSPWRKEFRKEWRTLAARILYNNNKYFTDGNKWICSCPYFAVSRFFLCKHLVVPMGQQSNSFFQNVQRNSHYPFISLSLTNPWKDISATCKLDNSLLCTSTSVLTDETNQIDAESLLDSDAENEYYEKQKQLNDILKKAQQVLEKSEKLVDRSKFLEQFEFKIQPLKKLIKDISHFENQHTLPCTWKNQNPNTQYYK